MNMSKICNSCGKSVDDGVRFCPYCKSQSFKTAPLVPRAEDNGIVHKLFYNCYDGYYVMSKAKVAGICVFLIFSLLALISGAPGGIVFFALLFGVLTYIIFYALRKIRGRPRTEKIVHNDYGFFTDLIHLAFYWQNNEGGFVVSKTKIICHIVFLAFFSVSWSVHIGTLFGAVIFGIIFEIPTFVVGYVIHKLVNPNPKAKPNPVKAQKEIPAEKPKKPEKVTEEANGPYAGYKRQLDDLNVKFQEKDRSTRILIEKRFEPPQLTYTRFISGVDKSKKLFEKNMDSAMTMIELDDEYSPRIAGEIESKISILKSIIDKLDDLSEELILNENLSKKEDVDELIDDMDGLINSVKQYNDE